MKMDALARTALSLTWLSLGTLKAWAGHGASSWMPAWLFWTATIAEYALAIALWSRWNILAEAAGAAFSFAAACVSIALRPAACGCMGFLSVSWKANAAIAFIMASTCLYLMQSRVRPAAERTQRAGGRGSS